jgi:Glycosyltransferase family 87
VTERETPVPEPAMAVTGGPLGRYASARASSWLATVTPLLVLASVTMSLGVVERAHCVSQGWNASDQFWHACFSDLPSLYRIGGLDGGLTAYLATGAGSAQLDQPVLTGAVLSLIGGLVPDGSVLDQTRWYFGLWAVVATVLVLTMVWLTADSRPRHAGDAAILALSPLLILVPLVSADVVGVALATAAIWAWARERPILAGVLLGLAVTARTYPLLIVLALVLLGLRTGRLAGVGRAVAAGAATVAVVCFPFLIANPEAVTRPYAAWWDSSAGLGSVWMVPDLFGHPLPAGAVTALTVVGLVLTMLAGALFALGTMRRPTLAETALVLVALALVMGKSVPVQASLWLLPLAALAGVRWRDHLVWVAAEGLHFVAVWLYVGGLSKADRGLPPDWYAAFLVIRVVAVLYLAWRVWHTAAQRPEHEPLDWDDDDLSGIAGQGPDPDSDDVVDELAGDFRAAPDRFLVRLG